MTILLLEDDAGVSELLRQRLQECGYSTISIQSAGEALAWLEKHAPDLMLVDYSLPDMNGKAFIEELGRRDVPIPNFLIITGREDVRLAVDMMKLGARDYLIKDLNFLEMLPEVLRKVEQAIEKEQKLKQAEKTIRENEEKFRMLFEEALNPILVVDREGRYLDANDAALEFLECERRELIGTLVWNFSPPSLVERQKQEHAPFVGRRMLETEYLVHGIIKTLLLNVVPLEKQGQKILYGIGQDITKRKKAEEALRANEEKFRALYNNAPLSYQSLDEQGCFIDVNPTWLKTLGYEKQEVIGSRFEDFLHPDWKAHFEKNFPEFKRRGYVHNVQFKIRHKDGRYLDISFEGCIGYRPDGSFRQTYCVFQDITERKRAEDALRESEERYRTLFEHLPIPVFTKDREGVYTSSNPENQKYWAVNPLGRTDAELLDEKNAQALRDTDLRVMETGETLTREESLTETPFGKRRVLSRKVPLRDADGRIIGILGASLDITDRKRIEEALKESEEKYRLVFQNSEDGIALLSIPSKEVPGVFLDVNEKYCQMLGYSLEEFLELSPWEVFTPEKQEEISKLKATLLAQKHLLYESILQHKAGQKIPVEINSQLFDYHGQMASISIIRNITERKQAEEKLKTALDEKEILLRELYHRTKNNMQVISSMLALQSDYINNEEALHIFKDMESRIQSMALIHEKLYQSQNLSRIDLGEYIDDLAALLFKGYATSQQIDFEIDAEEVFLLIDTAIPCGLIVNELLTNALKYAFPERQDGLIRVKVHRVETTDVALSISDNGVGVPEDFDLRNTKTLGLQTVFALAERQLHGDIHFTVKDGLMCHIRFRDDLYKERV